MIKITNSSAGITIAASGPTGRFAGTLENLRRDDLRELQEAIAQFFMNDLEPKRLSDLQAFDWELPDDPK